MSCPYCLGAFEAVHVAESRGDRIVMGMLRCRCFEFPIVEGVLMLALTKGYGGAEEPFQPYVPLQAAAIEYLRQGRPAALRAWMGRHAPWLVRLVNRDETYMQFMTAFSRRLHVAAEREVYRAGRSEVLGKPAAIRRRPPRNVATRAARWLWATRVGTELNALRKWVRPQVMDSFYVRRFLDAETLCLPSIIRAIMGPASGAGSNGGEKPRQNAKQVLSLCCGHGIFEFILRSVCPETRIVSLDGQILNLMVTKKFINPDGDFICHEIQFPLPFRSGAFDGVFSSTCLPEIPAQASFVRESIRVAGEAGWTLFDTIWAEDEACRVDPLRHYRYCQNIFSSAESYWDFFREIVPHGKKTFALPTTPHPDDPSAASRHGKSTISVLVARSDPRLGKTTSGLTPGEYATLTINPRYRSKRHPDGNVVGKLEVPDPDRRLPFNFNLSRRQLLEPAAQRELLHAGVLTFQADRFQHRLARLELSNDVLPDNA